VGRCSGQVAIYAGVRLVALPLVLYVETVCYPAIWFEVDIVRAQLIGAGAADIRVERVGPVDWQMALGGAMFHGAFGLLCFLVAARWIGGRLPPLEACAHVFASAVLRTGTLRLVCFGCIVAALSWVLFLLSGHMPLHGWALLGVPLAYVASWALSMATVCWRPLAGGVVDECH